VKPSAFAPRAPATAEGSKSPARFLVPVLFAVAGVALAVGARWWRYQERPVTTEPPASLAAAESPIAPAEPAQPAEVKPATPTPPTPVEPADVASAAPPTDGAPSEPGEPAEDATAAKEEPPQTVVLSAKERKRLAADQGLVEVVAGRKDEILIDGKRLGMGPIQRVALPAGEERHEVRVKLRGEERVRYVTVKPGVKLRLRMAPPWSR
jgi:type IV secretory pathway VirB10-like protein